MTESTLRTFRIGGQLDPAWLGSAPWTHVRATATLSRPDDGAPAVDPTNGAHEHPLTVVETLTATQAGGQWRTAALKPTSGADPDLALQPSGLAWTITLEIKRGATWHTVIDYTVALSGDRDYTGLGETVTVASATCVDINALIPIPITVPPSDAFADNVRTVADRLAIVTASEALTAGNLVNLWNDSGTVKARKASSSSAREAHGWVAATVSSGASATVMARGQVTGLTGLTVAAPYWLGASGGLLAAGSRTTTAGHIDQYVGLALSTTSLWFSPDPPEELA